MGNKITKFEDLIIWQKGVEMAVLVYDLFKNSKDFGFRDQVQRSSVSISSNIAEGYDRQSNNEFIRFLRIAKASCAELRTQLIIAQKAEIANIPNKVIEETKILSAMIQKMIEYRLGMKKVGKGEER
ncbi:MAG: four helix bundle protein [Bacteroidetes bacterium]|nr:four helix bundle protein [Bacteroidota bacterium]